MLRNLRFCLGGKISILIILKLLLIINRFLFYRQMMKELVHFLGDSVLLSRTHSQAGSTNIFTGVTADWNVARSLYSISDIQSCIDKVRPVRFGEHLVSLANFILYIFFLISFH